MKQLIAVAVLNAVLLSAALGREGDEREGHSYAEANCSHCHSIGKNALPSPNPDAPPFASIAGTSGMTGAALRVILQTPHRQMPDLMIPPKEKADVIAYILSLKQ
jgi:mono/diheme cytochrome c family protein